MDIDVSQLPAQAANELVIRHRVVRVLRDGQPVATLVPTVQPVAKSLQAFRDRVAPMPVTFAELLREERDAG